MATITMDHVRRAIELAEAGGGEVNGHVRKYEPSVCDDGTACNVSGFAWLVATGEPNDKPLPDEFVMQSWESTLLASLIDKEWEIPLIRAVAFGEDLQAAASQIRESGIAFWIPKSGETISPRDEELYIVTKNGVRCVGQTGGDCEVYGDVSIKLIGQMGGTCTAHGNAIINSAGQLGGDCTAHGNATINSAGQLDGDCTAHGDAIINSAGQLGGDCTAHGDAEIRSTGQMGGYCVAYDYATIKSTGQMGGNCTASDDAIIDMFHCIDGTYTLSGDRSNINHHD